MGVKDRIKAFEKASSSSGSPKATTTSPPRNSDDANVKVVQETSSPPTKPGPAVTSPPTNVNGVEAAEQQQQQNEGVEAVRLALRTKSAICFRMQEWHTGNEIVLGGYNIRSKQLKYGNPRNYANLG